jgi:hypothetical protein
MSTFLGLSIPVMQSLSAVQPEIILVITWGFCRSLPMRC